MLGEWKYYYSSATGSTRREEHVDILAPQHTGLYSTMVPEDIQQGDWSWRLKWRREENRGEGGNTTLRP